MPLRDSIKYKKFLQKKRVKPYDPTPSQLSDEHRNALKFIKSNLKYLDENSYIL